MSLLWWQISTLQDKNFALELTQWAEQENKSSEPGIICLSFVVAHFSIRVSSPH
jgi:hypothetical protein